MTINIDELTLGQVKQLQLLLGSNNTSNNTSDNTGLNYHIGQKVIIRTYTAGVWFGKLIEKSGNEVILENARRLWYWKAKKSISLSGVAVHGIASESKIPPAIDKQWLEAIEIISLTDDAIKSIEDQPDAEAS